MILMPLSDSCLLRQPLYVWDAVCSPYLPPSSPASLRYTTSSFRKHLLGCMWEKLHGNGEGELRESCGNCCQKQLIKHSFIRCGVTSINRYALKWPLEREINHCLSRRRKWTSLCVHYTTNQTVCSL